MLVGNLHATFEARAVTVRGQRLELVRLELEPLSSGGFNTVYTMPAFPAMVLRVSTRPLPAAEQRAYRREIAVQTKLAALGLSPRVHATLTQTVGARARIGVVMERFDATLEDVLRDAGATRRVFAEHDGERALVELLLRVSRVASCVDTKAANVVVRYRAGPVEFAMIDVDPYFCADRRGAACADLARCLRAGTPRSAVHAAVSLLILTLDAARLRPAVALPWPNAIDAMLAAWPTLARALRADARGGPAGLGAATSAMAQIAHYTGVRTVAGTERALRRARSASVQSRDAS
jgi:hypothetical protein